MPQPTKNESRVTYIQRCVRELKHEDPKRPIKECLGQCYSMFSAHRRKMKKGEKK